MEKHEFDCLLDSIKNIIYYQPLNPLPEPNSEDVKNIYEGLQYLSICMTEFNQLSQEICRGNFDISFSNKKNLLIGPLKELHSVLLHLTWQTQQVADGDYGQKVSSLGDFSTAFNRMISQLAERENQLREKTVALKKSTELLISLMSVHKDWIIVTDTSGINILYDNKINTTNPSSRVSKEMYEKEKLQILKHIRTLTHTDTATESSYFSKINSRFYFIQIYPIEWKNIAAHAHYISDNTENELQKQELTNYAYIDELTGTYNRRFCTNTLNAYISNKFTFTLIIIDINNLKFVNDHRGHLAGDEYICTVVATIKRLIRDHDLLCRIGGDEFVLVLEKCMFEDALLKMNRAQKELEKASQKYPMSISFGITYVDNKNLLSVDQLLNNTDEKMYDYKIEYKKTH